MSYSSRNSQIQPFRYPFALIAGVLLSFVCSVQCAFGANDFFSLSNAPTTTSSITYDQTNNYWNPTNETVGPLTNYVSGNTMIFGTNVNDFYGSNYTINLDQGGNLNNVTIGATNTVITFIGTANTHLSAASTWSVAAGSTLIEDDTRHNGLNMNGEALTFTGGGTIDFETPMGANDNNTITENMIGGTVNFQQTADVNGQVGFHGNLTLTNGTMNFATAQAAAEVFDVDTNGLFSLNGGTLDNTSGSPQTMFMGHGASYSIGGNFTFAGSSSLDFGTAGVTNKLNNTVTISANTLAIGGVISGNGNGITKLGLGTLLLYGANTYSGNTLIGAGTLALTNGGSIAGSPLIVTNATLDLSGLIAATTVPAFSSSNSTLVVNGLEPGTNIVTTTLNPGGATNIINFASLPVITGYPTVFHVIGAGAVNGTLNFGLGTLPPSPVFTGYISNNAANNLVDLVITNGPLLGSPATWLGTNGNTGLVDGTWDVGSTPTWLKAGVASVFNIADFATFDDTAPGTTTVILSGSVQPGTLTVTNNILSYAFTGGSLSDSPNGPVTLNKQGSATLTLQESGDSFTGGMIVGGGTLIIDNDSSSVQGGATIGAGGTVQVGNNDTTGVLPNGIIMDNGALVFNRGDNVTVNAVIDGNGVVEQINTNTITLAGISTGNWATFITNGTLQVANNSSLGSLPGGSVTVTNGGTLDLGGNTTANNANYGAKQIKIAGAGVAGTNGAIINSSGAQQQNAFQNVVLTADATVGGTSRWDIRGGTPILDLATHTLTKTNANQISLVSAHVTSGNIIVQQGILSIEETPNFDVSAGTITVESGALLSQYRDTSNSFTRSIVLNGGGTTNESGSGQVAFLDAPILLTADSSLGTGGGTEFFDKVISDGGNGFGITEIGIGTNLLAAANTYAGYTIVSQGTLGLTNQGSILDSAVIVVTNAAAFDLSRSSIPFTGTNVLVLGDDVQGNGALILGNTIITNFNYISISNATITLAVTNAGIPNITVTNLNLGDGGAGSTINITALPAMLGVGQYPLIKYVSVTGTYSLNLGPMPSGFGGNLVNNTGNNSIDLQITSVPSGVWNGGGSPDGNWSNPANWRGTSLTGNDPLVFTGTTGLNNTNDTGSETANGMTFASGAGAFVLNGNSVSLAGGITNSTANTQTINLGLTFTAPQTFTPGSGVLIIGGGLTNASSANTNTLTLAGTGILTNLLASALATETNVILMNNSAANWSLMDNPSSTAITAPWVLNDDLGTFNFGSATSAPNLTSTTVNGGPQDNVVGSIAGTSTLNFSNGTFTTSARLNTGVGTNATGIVNQYGGTLTLGSQFQGANGTGGFSTVNLTGGTMNIGSAANPASPFYVASRGPGTLTVSGSAVLNCGTLDVSRSINSSIAGTVNLNTGGTIMVNSVGTATANATASSTGSTGTFNFNGGILRARTNEVTFFSNSLASPSVPLTAVVKVGGAIIDSGTNAIGFDEALITDPALAGAQDGGLTKLGTGTLTLAMVNTYNGNTVVSAGTLALANSGAIPDGTNIIIAGGATFDVSALASFTLGSSQIVTNSGSTANIGGNFNSGSGTLSLAYASGTPSLSTTNGTLTLAATTGLQINNTGAALAAGTYTIIANTTGGSVAGTVPSSFTVSGGGIAPGTTASLQITGGALNLVVASSTPPPPPTIKQITFSGGTIIITGTNNNGAGGTYHVLTSTNVAAALSSWTVLTNGTFDGSGNFAFTNAVGTNARQFYILQVP